MARFSQIRTQPFTNTVPCFCPPSFLTIGRSPVGIVILTNMNALRRHHSYPVRILYRVPLFTDVLDATYRLKSVSA